MLKRSYFITVFIFSMGLFMPSLPCFDFGATVYGQNRVSANEDIIANYKQLTIKQLFDTASYYLRKNSADTALIYYNLCANTPVINTDRQQQDIIINAHNNAAYTYYYLCNYRSSFESLIKALLLCKKFNHESFEPKIYSNIGNIYAYFKEYNMAKTYYLKALNGCSDTAFMVIVLNNLGSLQTENEKNDTLFSFLNQALQIGKRHNTPILDNILHNIASFYKQEKQYDSALYYYRLSLQSVKSNHQDPLRQVKNELETECLSNIGELFFELHKIDSALFYIHLSNAMAVKYNFQKIQFENYLTLSKIEESKGNMSKAFEYFKLYSNLKDSVYNAKNLGDIIQLQQFYEVSRANQEIEQLVLEQRIKEHTIRYQKIIQVITLSILLSISAILLFVFIQNRRLNKAYKVLLEKNLEIMNLQENSSEEEDKKEKKSTLTDNMQEELLNRIFMIMKDTSIICDPKFSIDKLAELVQSNQNYISQVINANLKKNFRSFLNEYRIREAQRLFSESDTTRYTVEFVAFKVGFKALSSFRDTFKDITGVSPTFYLKEMKKSLMYK